MKGNTMITFAIVLLSICAIGAGILVIVFMFMKKKRESNTALLQAEKLIIKKKTKFSDYTDRFFQFAYNVYIRIPVVKRYLKKIRLKLEMVNDYTEYQIRSQSAKIFTYVLVLVISSLFVLISVIDDLYRALMVILVIMFVGEKFIDFMVTRVEDKILRQISDTFVEVRHAFHEHGMIEEALNEAIDNMGDKEIVPQIRRIKEALLADNPETELERYYDTAPNRFLKLFAGICYLVMEMGDRKVNGQSVFLKNLNNIQNDVYLEILKRDKLDYKFRSLTLIAIVPIFFMNPLKNWAESSFSSLTKFYNSSMGFITETAIIVSIFVAYLLLKLIKDDSEKIKFDRVSSVRWQEKVYKIPIIHRLINTFMPKKHTRKYKKETNLIKNTNSYLTIEWLYVNKFAYALCTIIASILLLINLHFIDINSIYTAFSDEFTKMGKLKPDQEAAAKEMAELDAQHVKKYRKDTNITKDKIRDDLKAETHMDNVDEAEIERLYKKTIDLQNAYLKWYEVIIALFLGYIAYQLPNLMLVIRNKMREMEKENEIMQFQSIILMLMYIERVDVQTIMEWLERYSYAFKESIATALNNYESGAVEALESLKEDVPYKDFERIVDGLISAVERIPVKDAFDELESERTFMYEKRKEANMRIIDKKVAYGNMLGFLPMILLIGGYLVVPLVIVSIAEMMTQFGAISSTM